MILFKQWFQFIGSQNPLCFKGQYVFIFATIWLLKVPFQSFFISYLNVLIYIFVPLPVWPMVYYFQSITKSIFIHYSLLLLIYTRILTSLSSLLFISLLLPIIKEAIFKYVRIGQALWEERCLIKWLARSLLLQDTVNRLIKESTFFCCHGHYYSNPALWPIFFKTFPHKLETIFPLFSSLSPSLEGKILIISSLSSFHQI